MMIEKWRLGGVVQPARAGIFPGYPGFYLFWGPDRRVELTFFNWESFEWAVG